MGSYRLTVTVHRHGAPKAIDISYAVTAADWSRSISQPWEAAALQLKAPVSEFINIVRPGDWIVGRDQLGTAVFWGHVAECEGGVRAHGSNVSTDAFTVRVESWLAFLGRTKLYAPRGDVRSRGTLLNINDWLAINKDAIEPMFTGALGKALAHLHQSLAKVRLPDSLGGEYIGDAVKVVYDEDTAKKWAPLRVDTMDPMVVGGGAPNNLSFSWYEGSLADMYVSMFVPEPALMELFPSLEDAVASANTLASTTSASSGVQPDASALAKTLGRTPVLVYRMRPWRPRPLRDASSTFVNFFNNGSEVYSASPSRGGAAQVPPVGQALGGAEASKAAEQTKAAVDAVALGALVTGTLAEQESARRLRGSVEAVASGIQGVVNQATTLANIFDKTTWKSGIANAWRFDGSAVRSLKFKWDDAARVNASSIVLGIGTDTGCEALPSLGLPLTVDESIEQHGLRLIKPTIPYVFPAAAADGGVAAARQVAGEWLGQVSAGLAPALVGAAFRGQAQADFFSFLRSYCAQMMQYHIGSHAMCVGVAQVDPVDVLSVSEDWVAQQTRTGRAAYVPHGEVCVFKPSHWSEALISYVDAVTHSVSAQPSGAESMSCSVSFSRGLFESQEDIYRDQPVKLSAAAPPGPQTGDTPLANKSASVQGPAVPTTKAKPVDKATVTENAILVGGDLVPFSRPVTRKMLSGGFTQGYRTGDIRNAIIHYSVTSSVKGLYNALAAGKVSSHFGIDWDGTITQFVDVRESAWHCGVSYVNSRSVGIDFVTPVGVYAGSPASAPTRGDLGGLQYVAKYKDQRWPVTLTQAKIYPAGTTTASYWPASNFLGPTRAQTSAAAALLAWLGEKVGLVIRHDPLVATPDGQLGTNVRRMTPAQVTTMVAEGGVWHHLQVLSNRVDSIGANLSSLCAEAGGTS